MGWLKGRRALRKECPSRRTLEGHPPLWQTGLYGPLGRERQNPAGRAGRPSGPGVCQDKRTIGHGRHRRCRRRSHQDQDRRTVDSCQKRRNPLQNDCAAARKMAWFDRCRNPLPAAAPRPPHEPQRPRNLHPTQRDCLGVTRIHGLAGIHGSRNPLLAGRLRRGQRQAVQDQVQRARRQRAVFVHLARTPPQAPDCGRI